MRFVCLTSILVVGIMSSIVQSSSSEESDRRLMTEIESVFQGDNRNDKLQWIAKLPKFHKSNPREAQELSIYGS